jgi:hypothetical protein
VRVADGQVLVAKQVQREEPERSGEGPLEIVLIVEIVAAEMILVAD